MQKTRAEIRQSSPDENNMLRALKRYGQNFMTDKNIIAFMISRSCACENDCVLEIGPGHGILTRALLNANIKCLHTIELDERFRDELEELALNDTRLNLHWGDAVTFDYASLEPFPNKVIANIPYNITTPLIWKLIQFSKHGLTYHMYMLQKEAALRLTAPPDTKARYPLGVAVESIGHASIIKNVSRECFRPVPNVDSVIAEIMIEKNFELAYDSFWSELLHKGFAQRRKTLQNNLKGFMNVPDEFAKMRAEDLTCDDWLKIYDEIKTSAN